MPSRNTLDSQAVSPGRGWGSLLFALKVYTSTSIESGNKIFSKAYQQITSGAGGAVGHIYIPLMSDKIVDTAGEKNS